MSSLVNKVPLTRRILEDEFSEFYYKLNKDKTDEFRIPDSFLECNIFEDEEDEDDLLTVYLRDYDRKPY